ncbi:MAG: 2-C-methyl-D-erythritol 2,4-cyclodiphosphate synthase [Planctomycetes bacterium]|nr:2-C-methyl-D-erythritol 2,4-cyclodiphosphate synthase [Planctomycetota bacterium]
MGKVGFGYDFHRLEKGKGFLLAGIKIPCKYAITAHSDGDILLHSLADAILGAIGEGDIGRYFPPGRKFTKDISSVRILGYSLELARKKRYKIANIDTTILLQEPKLTSYKTRLSESIAKLCRIPVELVNVKAKTTEGLGDIGRKKAISCYAVVLLERR